MTPASPGAPALSVETTQLAPAGFATVTPVYVIVPEPSAHISSPETLFSMVPLPTRASVINSTMVPSTVNFSLCTGLDVPGPYDSSVATLDAIRLCPHFFSPVVELQWALLNAFVPPSAHVNAVVPL